MWRACQWLPSAPPPPAPARPLLLFVVKQRSNTKFPQHLHSTAQTDCILLILAASPVHAKQTLITDRVLQRNQEKALRLDGPPIDLQVQGVWCCHSGCQSSAFCPIPPICNVGATIYVFLALSF